MIAPFLASFPRRVVVFNPTGRYATAQVASMREAGTHLIGGIALGRGGESLDGLALYDDVRELPEPADAAVIYTPPEGVLDAVRAAAGIPTIVVAAEYVPVHDTLRAAQAARAAGSWLVGPNTLGLCVPEEGLLGSIAPSFCTPGRVAVMCRSGTLTLTMARLLTAAGIGQRAVMHIGGDTIAGRNPHEYLAALAADKRTDAVLYCGEIGGDKEYALAEAIRACPKPVVTMLVGRHAPAEKRMGHAGALVGGARESAAAKLAALAAGGARTARDPAEAIGILKEMLQ
ncbi:succinyl-CoA synthetase subunit alpha [Siccirubricoccus deserti]|uniref:CoA-binding protein n=1 Tax=Siccirubricoccus deserti TaxID=2013562 RepID=A0A9X0QZ36_9PROT|nr:CoA-binding protein [Siccirubricoccus deserti]MBC4016504.1 CoA-binding protein [Siccirubricoccus deserti]GGC49602.1 succinyl-CoA synthetase subunit alpha [Siccirubricoccus deserti]